MPQGRSEGYTAGQPPRALLRYRSGSASGASSRVRFIPDSPLLPGGLGGTRGSCAWESAPLSSTGLTQASWREAWESSCAGRGATTSRGSLRSPLRSGRGPTTSRSSLTTGSRTQRASSSSPWSMASSWDSRTERTSLPAMRGSRGSARIRRAVGPARPRRSRGTSSRG